MVLLLLKYLGIILSFFFFSNNALSLFSSTVYNFQGFGLIEMKCVIHQNVLKRTGVVAQL